MPRSARPVDPLAAADPAAAVVAAHAHGRFIELRTSGSLAAPRSIVRSTASWFDSFPSVSRLAGIDSASRVWIPGPMTSTMNLFARVHAVASGSDVVDEPSDCTHAHLTPLALRRALDDELLGTGQTVVIAGDRLSPALRDAAVLRGLRVHHYYGASELSFVAWGSSAEDLRAFPEVEVDIREGDIWVRSPFLAEPDECETFRHDDGGWATVGDRGVLLDGVLRVDGRGAAAVTTAGATTVVADVESALRSHATGDIVIVGLPHDQFGEIVVGVVTCRDDVPALECASRQDLSPVQRPRRWYELPALPETDAGKIDRDEVRRRVLLIEPVPIPR